MYRGKDVFNFTSPAISMEGRGKLASLYQGKLTTISKEQESLASCYFQGNQDFNNYVKKLSSECHLVAADESDNTQKCLHMWMVFSV